MQVAEKVAFGPFEFDPSNGRLTKFGVRIKLQPRAASLLACLLERPGEVVTRDELKKRLWPDGTFVDFELGIKVAVKKVRDALNDSADEPVYVQTVHGTGYRFIATANSFRRPDSSRTELPARSEITNSSETIEAYQTAETTPAAAPAAAPKARYGRLVALAILVALSLTLLAGPMWHEYARVSPPVPLQLTFNTVDVPVVAAALSPDGKLLAYADMSGLYVRAFADGSTHVLSAMRPRWRRPRHHLLVKARPRFSQNTSEPQTGGCPHPFFSPAGVQ